MQEIDVQTLAERLQTQDDTAQFVDVREPQELAIAQLPGFINLPLSEYQDWGDRIQTLLDPDKPVIVLCHHGMRSAQMCQWLEQQGYGQTINVRGGIDAYSLRCDRAISRY
jgi:rhodanese-related sulfurtransferase